jgi:ribosomal protein S18 acetylase RimI-like enzyme
MPILFGRVRDEKLISDDIAYPIGNFIKYKETQRIEFRLAKLSDKKKIIDLRFQSFFDGGANCISALTAFKQKIDDEHLTIVACAENNIIGLIYGYNKMQELNLKEDYYIEYIYVHRNFRERNIGGILLNKMEEILLEQGFKKINCFIQGYQEHADIVYNFNLKNGFKNNNNEAFDMSSWD